MCVVSEAQWCAECNESVCVCVCVDASVIHQLLSEPYSHACSSR